MNDAVKSGLRVGGSPPGGLAKPPLQGALVDFRGGGGAAALVADTSMPGSKEFMFTWRSPGISSGCSRMRQESCPVAYIGRGRNGDQEVGRPERDTLMICITVPLTSLRPDYNKNSYLLHCRDARARARAGACHATKRRPATQLIPGVKDVPAVQVTTEGHT